MTDINLTDVTVHIDASLSATQRIKLEGALRGLDGVISVHLPEDKPHLAVVEYIPERLTSSTVLDCATQIGGHAELIGL